MDVVAIKGNHGPTPNHLIIWLSMSNDNVAVHRGKPKDVHENGCGKRNCVQSETEGQRAHLSRTPSSRYNKSSSKVFTKTDNNTI